MRPSSASFLLIVGSFAAFALATPGCGGNVADDSGASGSGPNIVGGAGTGGAGGTDAASGAGGSSSGNGGSSAGKGGSSSGKGGASSGKGGAPGDLFDLDVPEDAKPCYECAKDECKTQLEQCNEDPTCVEVATCLLDQCATDQSTQCALGCLDASGISVTDFNNPVVQTALGIGQCVQGGCADQCQVPQGGAGMGAGGGGPGGGSGGGSGGAGQSCSTLACAQACGQVGFACSQDAECKACLQDPSAPGCADNAALKASKDCCTQNIGVCAGCTGCSTLIDQGSAGASSGGSAGASSGGSAGASSGGSAGAGGETAGQAGAGGETAGQGGAAGDTAGQAGAAGVAAGAGGDASAGTAGAAGNP